VLSVPAMLATLSACVLGFTSGMRHALEPDHLAAVSTLVAGERTARASVRYALAWGAGHGAMLIVAGGALAVFKGNLPDAASDFFELLVAVALVALGVRGLLQAARAGRVGPSFSHRHGDVAHVHAGPGDHVHVNRFTLARLPFAIGLLHGLAGSGALAALVVARIPSAVFGVSFIAIYAVGAALGMAALAGVLGFPLARLARSHRAMSIAVGVSAFASLVVGVAWAAPILARFGG
jgi:hypothetical protein